jgi:hypothetical protein
MVPGWPSEESGGAPAIPDAVEEADRPGAAGGQGSLQPSVEDTTPQPSPALPPGAAAGSPGQSSAPTRDPAVPVPPTQPILPPPVTPPGSGPGSTGRPIIPPREAAEPAPPAQPQSRLVPARPRETEPAPGLIRTPTTRPVTRTTPHPSAGTVGRAAAGEGGGQPDFLSAQPAPVGPPRSRAADYEASKSPAVPPRQAVVSVRAVAILQQQAWQGETAPLRASWGTDPTTQRNDPPLSPAVLSRPDTKATPAPPPASPPQTPVTGRVSDSPRCGDACADDGHSPAVQMLDWLDQLRSGG